ncbi:MAG: hypothetical protein GOMPHAMPRED_002812 [Gomphillus americanus]|uniref:Heterokaryon incompatibility domain-containing protein n=1 Tax=Gomphillus americanus TaxID=1940652 RepID=A0A8H3FDN0_9LECA|nr:MAG: hypothetical protein GOMPHAMPRED_002812 [Gomphillus americanus]
MQHLGYKHSGILGHIRCRDPNIYKYQCDRPPNFHNAIDGRYGYILAEKPKTITASKQRLPETPRWTPDDFVQRWLFFDVLREVFRGVSEFDLKDFIEEEDNGSFITTERLPDLLKQWKKTFANKSTLKGRVKAIQSVLDEARWYAFEYCSITNRPGSSSTYSVQSGVDDQIALSVLLLGEALTIAFYKMSNDLGLSSSQGYHVSPRHYGWGYSRAVLKGFEGSWDSGLVQLLLAHMNNCTTGLVYAFMTLKPSQPPVQSKENYQPYHFCNGDIKDCTLVGKDEIQEVVEIIQRNQIPIFRYSTGNRHLEVKGISQEDNEKYIVFSHVWSDGFGNPKENTVNACVLAMFAEVYHEGKLRAQSWRRSPYDEKTLLSRWFWIDTLAIPVVQINPAARKKAITMMHAIYAKADRTFVLDLGLTQHEVAPKYTETAMRISLSAWNRRLWTLQEAVLSRKLYFNFQDQACSLQDLEERFHEEDKELHTCVPNLARSYYESILGFEKLIASRGHTSSHLMNIDVGLVGKVWRSTQWRTAEHMEDETLALATIFGLSTDDFSDGSVATTTTIPKRSLEDRMRRLVYLLAQKRSPIPVEFLFLPGPYLHSPGFRWAPQSWLSQQRVDHPDTYFTQGKCGELIVDRGLRVEMPGFEISEMETSLVKLRNRKHFYVYASNSEEWYRIDKMRPADPWPYTEDFKADQDQLQGRRKAAIILSGLKWGNGKREIALLVAVLRDNMITKDAEILRRVFVTRMSKFDKIKKLKQELDLMNNVDVDYEDTDDEHPVIFEADGIRDQCWLVDGSPKVQNRQSTFRHETMSDTQNRLAKEADRFKLADLEQFCNTNLTTSHHDDSAQQTPPIPVLSNGASGANQPSRFKKAGTKILNTIRWRSSSQTRPAAGNTS